MCKKISNHHQSNLMKNFFLIFVLSSTMLCYGQSKSFEISGTLMASDVKAPLESATIHLERVKDSTLVTYTISDSKGKFKLIDRTSDHSLNLYISYIGYKTYKRTIAIDKAIIDLKVINLETDTNILDEVVIRSRAPITIKKDTLEFNVKSFKTKKDANVEDLLKKLPGVEVDADGKIKVNGKEVNKILVNGKPFFGNDPTIATRNLTKDIIEKVQVTDTKTEAQAFSGETVDGQNKTINLTIKKENNKGVFGRLAAGAGTDKRNEFAGMFNNFDNDRRISVLVGGNNINSVGFSFGEIQKMFGRGGGMSVSSGSNGVMSFSVGGRSFGGGQGITTSRNAGVNYADKYGEKVDVSADYFHSGSSSDNRTTTERENILPDSRYFSSSNSNSVSDTDSHRANMAFDIKVDSTLLINIKPTFNFSKSTTNYDSYESSSTLRDDPSSLINESTVTSLVENTGKNFGNRINVTKRFGKNGAFIKFNLNNDINTSESDDFLSSVTNIYGDNPSDITRKQYTDSENKTNNINVGASYRMPILPKKVFLDFKYNYRNNKRENVRSTFDFDEVLEEYNMFNTDLSTDFEYIDQTNTPELRLSYNGKKLSTGFNASYILRTLENKDYLRTDLNIKRQFKDIGFMYDFNYRFSPKMSLGGGYRLTNSAPALSQLQAFQNVSNPLNIIVGNPNLRTSRSHNVDVHFNSFDFQKGTGLYGYLYGSFRNDQVVSKSTIDENLVRTTTYENVSGNYNLNANVFYNKKVKLDSIRSIRFGAGMSAGKRKNINFNNDIMYSSHVNTVSPSLNVQFIWKDVIEIRPRYRLSFTKNTYNLNNFEDQDFSFHNLSINTVLFAHKKLEWRNDVNYNYNPNIADGFQKDAWFWNSTLAYSFMKDNATLTLKAYDLLNQNTNARRIATQNFIQDSQSTVLQKYFMLTFSWKFNSLGKKGEIRKDRMFFAF